MKSGYLAFFSACFPATQRSAPPLTLFISSIISQINMLYGTITEFCTEKTCPVMNAGAKFEYLWADNNMKKPIKCSAPAYVDYLMSWVQDQIDDDSIFPSKIGVPFPKNFQEIAKTILKVIF